jgi:hypothetical protein
MGSQGICKGNYIWASIAESFKVEIVRMGAVDACINLNDD